MITNSPETNIEHVKIGILHFLNSVAYEPAIARATVTTIFDALKRSTIDLRNLDDPFPDKGSRIISYNNPCRVTDWSMLKEALTALKRVGAIEEEQRKDEEGQIKGTGRYYLAPIIGQEMLRVLSDKHPVQFTESSQQRKKDEVLIAQAEQVILRLLHDRHKRSVAERIILSKEGTDTKHLPDPHLTEDSIIQELAINSQIPLRLLDSKALGSATSVENPFKGSPSIIRAALAALLARQPRYVGRTPPTPVSKSTSFGITDDGVAHIEDPSCGFSRREQLHRTLSLQDEKDKAR